MDLRQLGYVVAVVDHGGVTRASVALHVAQPSVSAAIRTLEGELGVRLFDRVGRRMLLTDEGRLVVEHARVLLAGRDDLVARLSLRKGALAGRVRVAVLPTLVGELADLLVAFRRRYPGVRVEVEESQHRGALEGAVAEGRVEVGLGEVPPQQGSLTAVRLGRQEIWGVAAPGVLPDGPRIPVDVLAGHPVISSPPGSSVRDLLDKALRAARTGADVVVDTQAREVIVPLVLAGCGVTVLPERGARAAASEGADARPLQPAVSRAVGLVRRHAERPTAVTSALIGLARSEWR